MSNEQFTGGSMASNEINPRTGKQFADATEKYNYKPRPDATWFSTFENKRILRELHHYDACERSTSSSFPPTSWEAALPLWRSPIISLAADPQETFEMEKSHGTHGTKMRSYQANIGFLLKPGDLVAEIANDNALEAFTAAYELDLDNYVVGHTWSGLAFIYMLDAGVSLKFSRALEIPGVALHGGGACIPILGCLDAEERPIVLRPGSRDNFGNAAPCPDTLRAVAVSSADVQSIEDISLEIANSMVTTREDIIVNKWNERIAWVMIGGKAFILDWEASSEEEIVKGLHIEPQYASDRGVLLPNFYRFHELKSFHADKIGIFKARLTDKSSRMNELDVWNESPRASRYQRTAYAPGKAAVYGRESDPTYNLWSGWAYDLDKLRAADQDGSLPPTPIFNDFLLNVIAGGDEKLRDYILNWMAFTYQRPNEPIGVMLVMKGLEGVGKGTLWRIWRAPWGLHALHVSSEDAVFSRFSGHLLNCSAVFLDEAFWAGSKGGLGRMKAMITEPSVTIEPKGLGIIQIHNTFKFMSASNESWVVPKDEDSRRFQVLGVFSAWKGKKEKFDALREELRGGGQGAIFYRLMTRDISAFNPERDRVETDAGRHQARITRGLIVEWLSDFIAEEPQYALEDDKGLWVPKLWARGDFEMKFRQHFTGEWRHAFHTKFEDELAKVLGVDAAKVSEKRCPKSHPKRAQLVDRSHDNLESPWNTGAKCRSAMCWPKRAAIGAILRDKYGVAMNIETSEDRWMT